MSPTEELRLRGNELAAVLRRPLLKHSTVLVVDSAAIEAERWSILKSDAYARRCQILILYFRRLYDRSRGVSSFTSKFITTPNSLLNSYIIVPRRLRLIVFFFIEQTLCE